MRRATTLCWRTLVCGGWACAPEMVVQLLKRKAHKHAIRIMQPYRSIFQIIQKTISRLCSSLRRGSSP